MLPEIDIDTETLTELARHREPNSMTIYLASSRIPRETGPARIELKNVIDRARWRLDGLRKA
jgi:hypothetical protein